jgi:hypothetical protein
MKKLSILFAAFAVVFLASCGKYEDGPGFSLSSKTSRLAGSWTVTEAFQGSTNITTSLTNGGTVDLTFEKDGAYTYSYDFVIFGIPTNGSVSGTWAFSSDKTSLEITDGSGQTDSSKILRLTNNELWLEQSDSNGGTYEVHYSAK